MIPFRGIAYRILPEGADPSAPAAAPEGRFHHAGQLAIYTSLSPEGTVVAIRRYIGADDPPRVIVPLVIEATRLVDQRGKAEASIIWQELSAAGTPSPTWAFSDSARAAGAQGMLYSSRSRPDLDHLVLFPPFDAIGDQDGPALDAARWLKTEEQNSAP